MILADFLRDAEKKLNATYEKRERDNVLSLLLEETFHSPKRGLKGLMNNDVEESKLSLLTEAIKRLSKNEPIQYILGVADFYGLRLKVNSHVLIPRPETEELVDAVIKSIKADTLSVLDIGTGSGCIAIALKKGLPNLSIIAIDKSPDVINIAKENALANQCEINFMVNDFLNESTWESFGDFDVIISNPPYITQEEFDLLDARVRNFEPHLALITYENDPFIFYRKISGFGKNHLKSNGVIYLELNSQHASEIVSIFSSEQYKCSVRKDMYGYERILEVKNT